MQELLSIRNKILHEDHKLSGCEKISYIKNKIIKLQETLEK